MSPQTAASSVHDLMTASVLGVEPGMRVADALDLAREKNITHFPVVQSGRALGVVCTCDLADAKLSQDLSAVMHTPAATVDVDASIEEAAKLMATQGVGSLLVTEKNDVVGIVTRADIERAGLGEIAFGEQRCSSCGTYQHVKLDDRCGYWLCAECGARAHGNGNQTELGDGD